MCAYCFFYVFLVVFTVRVCRLCCICVYRLCVCVVYSCVCHLAVSAVCVVCCRAYIHVCVYCVCVLRMRCVNLLLLIVYLRVCVLRVGVCLRRFYCGNKIKNTIEVCGELCASAECVNKDFIIIQPRQSRSKHNIERQKQTKKKCHALSPVALAMFAAYRKRMTPRVIWSCCVSSLLASYTWVRVWVCVCVCCVCARVRACAVCVICCAMCEPVVDNFGVSIGIDHFYSYLEYLITFSLLPRRDHEWFHCPVENCSKTKWSYFPCSLRAKDT